MDNCNDRIWVDNPATCKGSKGNSCENVQTKSVEQIPDCDENADENSSTGINFACGSNNSRDPNESTKKEDDIF